MLDSYNFRILNSFTDYSIILPVTVVYRLPSNILLILGESPRVAELYSVRVTPSRYFFVCPTPRNVVKERAERLRRNTYRAGKVVEEGDGR